MMAFKKGERVAVNKGVHKKNGFGIYLAHYGNAMCIVRVKGDSKPSRNVWKSSIAKVEPVLQQQEEEGAVIIERKQHNQLTKELNDLSKQFEQFKLR